MLRSMRVFFVLAIIALATDSEGRQRRLPPPLPLPPTGSSDPCVVGSMPVVMINDAGNPVFLDTSCPFISIPNNTRLIINGKNYLVENADQPWSLEQYEPNLFRFELRSGDVPPQLGGGERTEISAGGVLYPPGTVVTVTYDFTLEAGPTNIAAWLVIGQWHSDWHSGIVQPAHPPMAFFLFGDDRLNIQGVWADTNSTTEHDMTLYADPNPLQRDHTYAIKIVTNFMNDATGFVQVWRDGVQIVNYNGPIGYGQATFWKEGIYRDPTNQTIAAWYENTTQTP